MKRSARQKLLFRFLAWIFISFTIWPTATYADTLHFYEPLVSHQTPTAKIILTFDDGTVDHYLTVFPLLKQYNIKGTFYVVTDCLIDGCDLYLDSMTTEQALEMYAAGMDIANHTKTHTVLKSTSLSPSEIDSILSMYSSEGIIKETESQFKPLSISQIEEELQGARLALDSLGMERASRHVAYPYGIYDDTALTAMKNTGMLTGRTINTGIDTINEIFNANKLYELSIQSVEEEDDLQTIYGWIDEAIGRNATLILLFHRVREIPDGDDPYDISRIKFEQILGYISASQVECRTITEWYADYLYYIQPFRLFFPIIRFN
jgi:peptidoglycan/xylan/chitin deacetylase (PgdA/CDA1 family)